MSRTLRLALLSILIGLVVFALKFVAWFATGSLALLSDMLESLVNIATALATSYAIYLSAKPADKEHPYGHHKAEHMSAVLEGVLIILAALMILRATYFDWGAERTLSLPSLGVWAIAGATAINALWSVYIMRKGRALKSPALVAEGIHIWTDVITTVAVVAGLLLSIATGWILLDRLMAMAVALHILWSGFGLLRGSISGLMDEAVPDDLLQDIQNIIARSGTGADQAHDLRTRHIGDVIFVDFHLVVDGDMSVHDAHILCDKIEAELRNNYPNLRPHIHVEPAHKAKQDAITIE